MNKDKKTQNKKMNNPSTPASAGVDSNSEYVEDSKKSNIVAYVITFVIACLFTILIAISRGIFDEGNGKKEVYRCLADSLFLPGASFLGIGLLVKIAAEGLFDGVSYLLKYAFYSLIPGGRLKKEDSYYDYKQKKAEKRKTLKSNCILIIGLLFTLLSILFTFLFNAV